MYVLAIISNAFSSTFQYNSSDNVWMFKCLNSSIVSAKNEFLWKVFFDKEKRIKHSWKLTLRWIRNGGNEAWKTLRENRCIFFVEESFIWFYRKFKIDFNSNFWKGFKE